VEERKDDDSSTGIGNSERNHPPLQQPPPQTIDNNTPVLPLSGPCPTHLTRQQSGATVEDVEDTSELDPEWTKRQLFGRYCFNLGYTVTKGSSMEV
jgi:hypothetical protein